MINRKAFLQNAIEEGFKNKVSGYPLTLKHSKGKKLIDYRVYGNSIQNGTPTPDNPVEIESVGDKTKNLFDISELTDGYNLDVSNGLPTAFNGRCAMKTPIDVSNYEEITLSYSNKGIYFIYSLFDSEEKLLNRAAGELSGFSIDVSEASYLYIAFYSNTPVTVEKMKDIQLEKGSTATEYEPYGKYKIPITVSGKNMFNRNAILDYALSGGYLEVTDTGYNILKTESFTHGFSIGNFKDLVPDLKVGDKFKIYFETNAIRNEKAVNYIYLNTYGYTLITNTEYTATEDMLNSAMYIYSGGTENCYLKNIMVYKSTETSDFEPYQETVTKNIYLDEPLRKIGDYADYIDFKEQKVVRKINTTNLSAESTSLFGSNDGTLSHFYKNFSPNRLLLTDIMDNIQLLSNKLVSLSFKDYASESNNSINAMTYNYNNKAIFFKMKSDLIGVTDNMTDTEKRTKVNEYLTNNPITVNYILESPIEKNIYLEPITTINGTNIITTDTTIELSNLAVEYKSFEKGE